MTLNSAPPSRKERALALLRENRLDEAKALCEDVCRSENQPGAWYLLGVIHGMIGDAKKAEDCYRMAVELKPDYADAHFQLGVALAARGRLDEGIAHFRQTARFVPNHSAAHAAIGNAQAELHRFEDAVASYRQALEINPANVEVLVNFGNALSELGHKEEAITAYRQAINCNPRFPNSYHNLGLTLLDLDRLAEAVETYRSAVRTNPGSPMLFADLGVALSRIKNHDEAAKSYRQALSINPNDAKIHYNLANALWALGKLDDTVENYHAAIRLQPGNADAHVNLGLVQLSLGDFRQGWKEYDWQWRREGVPARPFPPSPWDGSDLGGRAVFLHDEQGLGDELFFLRFVPQLRCRGAGKITYRPSAKLASLVARVSTLDSIAARDARPPDSALVLSVGDLPRLLGMERVDQIPPPVLLAPLPEQIIAMQKRLNKYSPLPYIGVTWRAGTTRENALYKEAPLVPLARSLRDFPGTVLILQRHPKPGEIGTFQEALGKPAHDLSVLSEDVEQTLALLSLIDDYVGVSNTNMHLRAGTGKTARVLVPAPAEWRWMAEGRESPWFPGFTVYRQDHEGGWDNVLQTLECDWRQTLMK